MKNRWLSLILLLSFVLASCAPSKAGSVSSRRQSASSEELSPTSTENPLSNTPASKETPSDPAVVHLVSLAKKDLAERLHVATNGINLVEAARVTWPDSALGCPSPGKVYAQAEVPGYRIQLEAESRNYSYHMDRLGQFILCSTEEPDILNLPEFPVTPGEINDGKPWVPVQ